MPVSRQRTEDMREQLPPAQPTADRGPDKPSELDRRSWWGVLKRVLKEYQRDNLSDWAAALTYYAILSLFPGLLVLVTVLGLAGSGTVTTVTRNLEQLAPGATRQILVDAVHNIQNGGRKAGGIPATLSRVAPPWSPA